MANFFKDEIDHIGDRLEKAIEKAGDEISAQRSLTKSDIEQLIQFAAQQFGQVLDERIEKARHETSELVVSKIAHMREQLSEAAAEQKRVALRNASVAVGASIVVGVLSIYYKKYVHGDIDLIDVFRSVMLAFASGYFALLCFKGFQRFFLSSSLTRNGVIVGLRYFDVLRPRGAWMHVVLLSVIFGVWALLNFAPQLQAFFQRI
jgi:hypothetical protein